MEAHSKFEGSGQPLPESMKIIHFKQVIYPEANLKAELAVARSRKDVNVNFETFTNKIKEGIASIGYF